MKNKLLAVLIATCLGGCAIGQSFPYPVRYDEAKLIPKEMALTYIKSKMQSNFGNCQDMEMSTVSNMYTVSHNNLRKIRDKITVNYGDLYVYTSKGNDYCEGPGYKKYGGTLGSIADSSSGMSRCEVAIKGLTVFLTRHPDPIIDYFSGLDEVFCVVATNLDPNTLDKTVHALISLGTQAARPTSLGK